MTEPGYAEELEEEEEDTQVTKLLTGMKETVEEQVSCTKDLGDQADRVKRLARRPEAPRRLRAVSEPPDKR